jgi:hypothetical protein
MNASNSDRDDGDSPNTEPPVKEVLIVVEAHGPHTPTPLSPDLLEYSRRRRQEEAELQKLYEQHREELERLPPLTDEEQGLAPKSPR